MKFLLALITLLCPLVAFAQTPCNFRAADTGAIFNYNGHTGHYCGYSSWQSYINAGGDPNPMPHIPNFGTSPSNLTYDGSCGATPAMLDATCNFHIPNGTVYFTNEQGHTCFYSSYSEYISDGGNPDIANNVPFVSGYPSNMVNDGDCNGGSGGGSAPQLTYNRGGGNTHKVCQLLGDTDFLTGQSTQSQSWTQAGVPGSDLGVTSYHNGQPWILFGDVVHPRNPAKVGLSDPYGYITSSDGDQCLAIAWQQEPTGAAGDYHAVNSLPEWPNGMPGFNVPLAVFDDSGNFYSLTTDNGDMSRSVLNQSSDNGWTWTQLYTFSTLHFINVSVEFDGGFIYFFGTGNGAGSYRNTGQIYAARMAQNVNAVGSRSNMQFWNGSGWTSDETTAAAVINEAGVYGAQGGLGELSVKKIQAGSSTVWVALYNCAQCNSPNGTSIVMKTAASPTGPWSASQLVLDPYLDNAYCTIMWESSCANAATALRDTQAPGWGNGGGGLYGPYLIPHLTKQIDAHTVRIFYTVSTWIPYNSVEMATDLNY